MLEEVEVAAKKELKRLERMSDASSEYTIISIPGYTEDEKQMKKELDILNQGCTCVKPRL